VEEYPALDLACAYPDRWGCEIVIGRYKTDIGEGQPVLGGKDPEGVVPEMWTLFTVYRDLPAHWHLPRTRWAPARTNQLPARPGSLSQHGRGFPLARWTALTAFLFKILMPAFLVRPDRASPSRTKGWRLPARKPGEPSVTAVTRRIEFHLLQPSGTSPKQGYLALGGRPLSPGRGEILMPHRVGGPGPSPVFTSNFVSSG
jgi:hypothetical protein